LVSHELRTPLTVVSTAADNLLGAGLPAPEQERLHKIRRATERMRGIIEGYLNAERLTQPLSAEAVQRVNILSLCRQAIQTAQEKQAHPIELQRTGSQEPVVMGNALHLKVALDNLIGNAVMHSHADATIEVTVNTDAHSCCVSVTNSGEPIADHDLPHLFERFYRGSNAKHRAGSGLGLYLVQQIAEQHGGRVEAENIPNGRCRFSLKLISV
jgi:signal transduction histidine kinase